MTTETLKLAKHLEDMIFYHGLYAKECEGNAAKVRELDLDSGVWKIDGRPYSVPYAVKFYDLSFSYHSRIVSDCKKKLAEL